MLNFKKEIFHHAACEIDSPVAQKAEDDEIAVPAIHFIETSARDDVLVLKVKKTGRLDPFHVRRPHLMDDMGEAGDGDLALALHLLEGLRSRKVSGQVDYGGGCQFGIQNPGARTCRASQRIPTGPYVRQNRVKIPIRKGGKRLRLSRADKTQQERKDGSQPNPRLRMAHTWPRLLHPVAHKQ